MQSRELFLLIRRKNKVKVKNIIELLSTYDENMEVKALDIKEDKVFEISCTTTTEGDNVKDNIVVIGFERE